MAVGIVCEYNPFHNGHKYQIEMARKLSGDSVVCVMSGELVQRGELAVAPGEVRAKWAIDGGADLVLELPYPFSCSSAEIFADSAVEILCAIPCVDKICFGAEDDDRDRFVEIARILLDKDCDKGIRDIIKQNKTLGYAQARSVYLKEKYGAEYDEFLKKPNNILGVEYTKAVLKRNADIDIIPIRRMGVSHDDKSTQGDFCSATYLRENVSEENFIKFTPIEKDTPIRRVDKEKLYAALCTVLMYSGKRVFAETDPGMMAKLKSCALRAKTYDEFFDLAKSKHITDARLRRSIVHILCRTEKDYFSNHSLYTRLLASSSQGNEIMKGLRGSEFPVLSKVSDAKKYGGLVSLSLERSLCAGRIFEKLLK